MTIDGFSYGYGDGEWDKLASAGVGNGMDGDVEAPKQVAHTMDPNSTESTCPDSSEEGSDESPETFKIRSQMLMIELELSAWMALEEVAAKPEPIIEDNITLVQRYLKCPSQSTLSAALALHEISNAVAKMDAPDPGPTMEKLIEAEKAVRDVVVSRCQFATEFGVRHLFVKELQKVFDYQRLDSNARSKLMHSHRTIFGTWPGVFKSHCTHHAKLRSQRKYEKRRLAEDDKAESGCCE